MGPEVRAVTVFAQRDRMVQTPDNVLAARCRAGEADAFAEVYARCERPVFRYAYHVLGCREEADDAKQETFLRAWQSIRGFKGECALHIWLLRICANICRDRIKANRRRPVVQIGDFDDRGLPGAPSEEDPHAQVVREAETSAVRRAMMALPPTHREIIVLREMEDLSYGEIATALGCSVASVKVRLFRARRLLKQRLIELFGEPQ